MESGVPVVYAPSEMSTSPPLGGTEWAVGDSGEKLWLKTSACESSTRGGDFKARLWLDVVSAVGSGLDEVTRFLLSGN